MDNPPPSEPTEDTCTNKLPSELKKGQVDLQLIDIVPPRTTWYQAAKLREKFVDYMPYDSPHISFIPIFICEEDLEQAAQILEAALADNPIITISFPEVLAFPKRRKAYSRTVYARPEIDPPNGLQELYTVFFKLFPQCFKHGVLSEPHLTLAQFPTDELLDEHLPIIQKEWVPFSFKVSEIHLLCRSAKREPFEIKFTIPIGKSKIIQGPGMEILPSNPLFRTLILIRIPKVTQKEELDKIFLNASQCIILPNPPERQNWVCAAVVFENRETMLKAISDYPTNLQRLPNTEVKPLERLMLFLDMKQHGIK